MEFLRCDDNVWCFEKDVLLFEKDSWRKNRYYQVFRRFCVEKHIWVFIRKEILKKYDSIQQFKEKMLFRNHGAKYFQVFTNKSYLSFVWNDYAYWKSISLQWRQYLEDFRAKEDNFYIF